MDKRLTGKSLIVRLVAALCAAAVMVLCFFAIAYPSSVAYAASVFSAVTYVEGYNNVYNDLCVDSDFDLDDFPEDDLDYSLALIQVAESEDNELFVYVYQPCLDSSLDLTVESINISTTVGDGNLRYRNYGVTLLNSYGTLFKYRVDDFSVSQSNPRYYNISSMYRSYNASIDGSAAEGNIYSGIAVEVAQEWQVGTYMGEVGYYMTETEVVTITDMYCGFIRFYADTNPFDHNNISQDQHFLAFSCDYDIDFLYEADVSFRYQDVVTSWSLFNSESTSYGDVHDEYYIDPLTISYDEELDIPYRGWRNLFNKRSYSFNRILTPSEYIECLDGYDCDFGESDLPDKIGSMQYVLNFYESEYNHLFTTNGYYDTYYRIYDETILRLMFEVEGVVYDLGVVSNKVSVDPDNYVPSGVVKSNTGDSVNCGSDFWNTVLTVLLIIALVLIIVVLWPVWKLLAKFVVWVFTWPFKAYKKHKEKKRQKEAQEAQQAMIESSQRMEDASRSLENSVGAFSAANGRDVDPDYKAVLERLQRLSGDSFGNSSGRSSDDKK